MLSSAKRSGSVFWQVGSFSDGGVLIPLDIRFFPIFESLGMLPRNRIVWARQHGLRPEEVLLSIRDDPLVHEIG